MKPFRARVDLNPYGEAGNLSYKTTGSTLLKVSTQLLLYYYYIIPLESSSELRSRSVMGPGSEETGIQGVTKRCRLSLMTNSALAYEPKCRVSANENSCTRSPNKLWRSNSIIQVAFIQDERVSERQFSRTV